MTAAEETRRRFRDARGRDWLHRTDGRLLFAELAQACIAHLGREHPDTLAAQHQQFVLTATSVPPR